MGIQIEDGLGTGLLAQVIDERLRVHSASASLSNHIAVNGTLGGTVYTMFGTATPVAGAAPILFVLNNDPSLLLVFERITVQAVALTGGTALPNTGAYFSYGYGRTFTSGGTTFTPVNTNRTSTNVANGTFMTGSPALVLAGTFTEASRIYAQPNAAPFELCPVADNDIILGRQNTLEVRYTGDNTGGVVLAMVKFFFATQDHMG